MQVLVFLSGIADPKRELPSTINEATLTAQRANYPLLSPFDEAALEVALKLRDADPSISIRALVGTHGQDDTLLRHVAGFRLDQVEGFDLTRWPAWNVAVLAAGLASQVAALPTPPDLCLIGREFGDLDDGSLPAALAAALNRPFASLALELKSDAGALVVTRQQGTALEQHLVRLPAAAAITNHPRNRLRHPLLKNVMAAKKMRFEHLDLGAAVSDRTPQLRGVAAAHVPVRQAACRMLGGDPATQARELIAVLMDQGATP